MISVNDIRSEFLEYFDNHDHHIMASGPLVPDNDPTLMFTNAGMVQFKNIFIGQQPRPFARAVTSQKCVRAGGKHNDLDNVGRTARHHTFFEMLGNFSFGDYFKEGAIELAWNFITREIGLSPERLLVTVHASDNEAHALWRKIAGLDDAKIIRIDSSDNFWSMGDTGPCGPCSEIFYDHGSEIAGGPPGSPDEDGDRFIEIWNLVFMQYEQLSDRRIDLPSPSIDTGMGLERLAAVLQGKHDNFDIDLFQTLIKASEQITGIAARGKDGVSHRIIADHLRASSFLVGEGVLPSNEGRGYVLRRIMRRAMRHAHLLGAEDPLLYRLLPTLINEMGQAFPELARARALISQTLELEETRFHSMLARGLTLLDNLAADLKAGQSLDGETAFRLYDTYGFPLDLTQEALSARNIDVDVAGFNAAMERQRQAARAHWAGTGDETINAIWGQLQDRLGVGEFLGYQNEKIDAVVTAIVSDQKESDILEKGTSGIFLFNQTVFYGESGGQVGDTGWGQTDDGDRFKITNTRKIMDGLILHEVEVIAGAIKLGQACHIALDHERRRQIRANHSATHLLHEALRQVLGEHVAQKGSLVAPDRLRFDFSHPSALSGEEIRQISDLANRVILQNGEVSVGLMGRDEAVAAGARALFGEKYGQEVRVVSMGLPAGAARGEDNVPAHGAKGDERQDQRPFSLELCGGTHVSRTGDIGLVAVTEETGIAAGIRRIEALSGEAARHYLLQRSEDAQQMAALLKSTTASGVQRLQEILDERRKLERALDEASRKLAMAASADNDEQTKDIAGIAHFEKIVDGFDPRKLKSLADAAKNQIGSGIVTIINRGADKKASVVVGVTPDLAESISAVDLVRVAAQALGGKGGGGRAEMAQAGGADPGAAEAAISAVGEAIRTHQQKLG